MSSKHINSLNIRSLPDFPSLSLGYHISVVCDRKLYVIGGVNAVYDDSDDTNSRINQQIPYSGSDSNTRRFRSIKCIIYCVIYTYTTVNIVLGRLMKSLATPIASLKVLKTRQLLSITRNSMFLVAGLAAHTQIAC